MHSPKEVLSDYYCGQIIEGFEFGTTIPSRKKAIGKMITDVRLGFNEDLTAASMIITMNGVDEPILIYPNEVIHFR